jgi:hypothetical protein
MAEDTDTSDSTTADALHGKNKKSKQQRMLIIIGVVGLILTYVLLRSRASSSSSSGTATTGTDQALAQYEQTNASDLAGLQSQLQSLQGVVAGMYPTMGSGDGTTGTSTGTGTTSAPPTTTTTNTAPAPSGPTYTGLTDSSLLQPLTMSNTPLFYMAGGNYEQVGDQPGNTTDPELAWIQQNLQPGTGIYVQNS